MVFFRLSIELRKLIDQRAFASTRRARQAYSCGPARMRKKFFEKFNPSRRVVLDHGDRACQRTRIAGTKEVYRISGLSAQAIKCKTDTDPAEESGKAT